MKNPSVHSIAFGIVLCLLSPHFLQAQSDPKSPKQLRRAIDSIVQDQAFDNAWWAILVVDLNKKETLYEHNATRSFIPASNTKLYTTAAALDILGPSFRYTTSVFTDGYVEGNSLIGNLIVRGSGDPVIGGRFNDGDLTETFRAWADSLKQQGITHIEGDIIGDDDVFDDQALGYGWSWDDEPFWYSAEISGLSFNDNCVDFALEAQTLHEPARIRWEPFNTTFIRYTNATRTISSGASIDEGYARPREENHFYLSSLVPEGQTDYESLTVHNPTLYFVHVLRETLIQEGISVLGLPIDLDALSIKPAYEQATVLASHQSVPLADIVRVINKRSHNLYAEQVLKTLAAEHPLPDSLYSPGSAAMGIGVATETFARAGVDTSRIQLVDGSGLSRQNLVTAEMTLALLRYMWQHEDETARTAFLESLPIGGLDGTLRFRYGNGPARGNVRAKTGTVSNASTLSGYITTARDTPLAFVLMVNHYTVRTAEVRAAQDAIINTLASYQR